MPDVTDPLWQDSQGDLIDRVHELEGLLAGTTRKLEFSERELAEVLEREPGAEMQLAELTAPEHLARIEDAITRIATDLCNAGDASDLWMHTEQGETRLAVLASAILTLASAHDRVTPKPLPMIERQGHLARLR